MAGRIRSIKPETLEDEKAAGLSDSAWRLWISMWLVADDHGRLRGTESWLKGQVWWHENHAGKDMDALLVELVKARVIRRYEVEGQKYIEVRTWKKHQKVDHPSAPRIPEPVEEFASPREPSRALASPRETLATDQDLRSGSGSVPPIRTSTFPASQVAIDESTGNGQKVMPFAVVKSLPKAVVKVPEPTPPSEYYLLIEAYEHAWVNKFHPEDGKPPPRPAGVFKHAKQLVDGNTLPVAIKYALMLVNDTDPHIRNLGNRFVDIQGRIAKYKQNANAPPENRQYKNYSTPRAHVAEGKDEKL